MIRPTADTRHGHRRPPGWRWPAFLAAVQLLAAAPMTQVSTPVALLAAASGVAWAALAAMTKVYAVRVRTSRRQ